MSPTRLGLLLAAVALVLDQATKWLTLATIASPAREVVVLPFLSFVLAWNRGVSFGMFGGAELSPWVFVGVSLAISALVSWWLWREQRVAGAIGLGLVLGGALGNVVDRIVHGAVVDFLLLHWRGWSWPVFNVADMAITVGAVLVLMDSLFDRRSEPK